MNEWEIPPVQDSLFNLIAKCRFGPVNLACSPEEARGRRVSLPNGAKLKKIVAPAGSRPKEFLETLAREHALATLELLVACLAANDMGMIAKTPIVAAGSPEPNGKGGVTKYPCIYLDLSSGERTLDKCDLQVEDCGGIGFLVLA